MQGFHPEMRAAQYHADPTPTPSLSSSIAKTLLARTPRHAWCQHPRLNPDYESDDDPKFSLGSVAHELLLSRGAGFIVVDADDWRGKEAKAKREEAQAAGLKALLAKDHARAMRLVEVTEDRLYAAGFRIDDMERELPYFWQDHKGVWCRAMTDVIDRKTYTVIDFKTMSLGLTDENLARTIDNLGYDLSAGHYIRGLTKLMPESAGRWRWLWLVAETTQPHEVRIIQADASTLEIGDRKAATAMVKWERCLRSGEWPGYSPEISMGGIPDWAVTRWTNRELEDPDCMEAPFLSQSRTVEREPKPVVWGAG